MSLANIAKHADNGFLESISVQPAINGLLNEAYLPQIRVETDIAFHDLIINQNLETKEVYKYLVQMLAVVDQSKAQFETVPAQIEGGALQNKNCNFCMTGWMNFSHDYGRYACNTCGKTTQLSVSEKMQSHMHTARQTNEVPRWWKLVARWAVHICNGYATENDVATARRHVQLFMKHTKLRSVTNTVAAALLIAERPTILSDQKIGPLKMPTFHCCGKCGMSFPLQRDFAMHRC